MMQEKGECQRSRSSSPRPSMAVSESASSFSPLRNAPSLGHPIRRRRRPLLPARSRPRLVSIGAIGVAALAEPPLLGLRELGRPGGAHHERSSISLLRTLNFWRLLAAIFQ